MARLAAVSLQACEEGQTESHRNLTHQVGVPAQAFTPLVLPSHSRAPAVARHIYASVGSLVLAHQGLGAEKGSVPNPPRACGPHLQPHG